MQRINFAGGILIFCLCALNIFAQNPEKTGKTVPWDSVMAELQTVHFLPKPDSVKALYYQGIFQKFKIDSADYAKFYYDFQTWKPKRQRTLLLNVEKILFNELRDIGAKRMGAKKRLR